MRGAWARYLALFFGLGLTWLPVGSVGNARAAGIRDLADGWLLGPTMAASLTGGDTIPEQTSWLRLGHSRLFGLPDLPVADLVIGQRLGWHGLLPDLAAGWQVLGRGLYREMSTRLDLQWGHRIRLGVQVRSLFIQTGGGAVLPVRRESFHRVAATIQTGWRLGPLRRVQLRAALPAIDSESYQRREGRRRLLGLQVRDGVLALAAEVDVRPDQSLTVGLEWAVGWGTVAVGMRLEPAVDTLGPSLVWRRGRLLFRSSHLAHAHLGVTHRFQIGFGWGGGSSW